MKKKVCKTCKLALDYNAFKYSAYSKDHRQDTCKDCQNKRFAITRK